MLEIVDKQQSEPYQQHYLNDNTSRDNSTASSFRRPTTNRTHTNSHSNNNRHLSYINNSSVKPMMHSQDVDGALDLDTLLSNTASRSTDTSQILQQKENHYKPHSLNSTNSPSNAAHTNPYNSTNKSKNLSTVSKGYVARSEDHELDWNLFDAPTTTKNTATTINNITSTTQHSTDPVVTTAANKTYNVSACTIPSTLNTIQGDKSVGQKRKAIVDVGKPGNSLYSHRASRDDVELRLEDLF